MIKHELFVNNAFTVWRFVKSISEYPHSDQYNVGWIHFRLFTLVEFRVKYCVFLGYLATTSINYAERK